MENIRQVLKEWRALAGLTQAMAARALMFETDRYRDLEAKATAVPTYDELQRIHNVIARAELKGE